MNTTKEFTIAQTLKRLGVSPNWDGYGHLKTAMLLCLEDPSLLKQITSSLYPAIAKTHQSIPTRVERTIRHAIEAGCLRADLEFFDEVFGYSLDPRRGKPTNGEFLATVADYLKMTTQENTDGT